MPKKATLRSPTTLALLALVLGLTIGIIQDATGSSLLARLNSLLEPVGALWVNAIRMMVIPLVISFVIGGVSGVREQRHLSALSRRVLIVFVSILAITAAVCAAITPFFYTWLQIDPASVASLRASASAAATAPPQSSLRDWLLSVIPSNPIKSAVDGAMLPLFIFSLAYGFAFRRVQRESAEAVLGLLEVIKQAALTVVSWVIAIAPIGVFALALGLGVRFGASAAGAIGYFVVVFCVLHVLVGLALYPIVKLITGLPMRRFAYAAAPAQIVAVSTRTSSAALPALYQGAERLGVSPEVAGFVLPLAISAFRLSSPVNWPIGALFVAHLYGIPLGPLQLALIALASVLLNPASPAVPSGGLFVQAPVYLAVGLPVEGLAILIAVDAIPDIFKTVLNVTADMAALSIIAPQEPATVTATRHP